MTRIPSLRLLAAGATLVVAGLAVPLTPAVAAEPTPAPSGAATVSVTVPTATPTASATPSPSPSTGSQGGGSNGGSSTTGGSPSGTSGTRGSTGGSSSTGSGGGTTGPVEPTIGKSPSTTAEQASVDKTAYNAGDTITVSFSGFTPNEKVQLVLYSDPVLIGNFPADAAGTLTQSFQLPSDLPAGAHTVQLTGWESKKVASASIVVASAATAAAPDVQGVPVWAWWIGGALLAVLAAFGTWWLIRTMRAPAPEASAA